MMKHTERIAALSRQPNSILDTHGVRLIIKDMGNGVRSVVDAGLLPIEQCLAEVALEGRIRIPYPFPGWLDDLRMAAVIGMGIDTSSMREAVCHSYARSIDERTVEYIGWRISG